MNTLAASTNIPEIPQSASSGVSRVYTLVSTSPTTHTSNTIRKDINEMDNEKPEADLATSAIPQPEVDEAEIMVEPKAEPQNELAELKPVKKQVCHEIKQDKQNAKSKKSKKVAEEVDSETSSESDSSSSSSSEEDSESESSEDERSKQKAKKAKKAKKVKSKKGKGKKAVKEDDSSDSSQSEDSSEDETPKRKKKSSKSKKVVDESSSASDDEEVDDASFETLQAQIDALWQRSKRRLSSSMKRRGTSRKLKSKKKSSKKSSSTYRRVDQIWDTDIHDFRLRDSNEAEKSDYDGCAWLVRRCFNWENKPSGTVVDIKSKQLRTVLKDVMKDCKTVSLEAEEPVIDPNMLFLYLEDLRSHCKTLKKKIKVTKKVKMVKKLGQQRSLCKAMVAYIDEDYADTKKTLYPLLNAGNITFDLLWALFKPNEVAVTSTYGIWDDPRCFKVDYANKSCSMTRGEWYTIEGVYLEYDGKSYGFGDFEAEVDGFKGPRKITSLATYPLRYHKDPDGVRKKIIERGQRFVSMEGMQYKAHQGLAFMKKKKQVLKISTNSRIMVDPSCFRRINPNYPISFIKPKDAEELFSDDDSDDCACCDSDDEQAAGDNADLEEKKKRQEYDGTPKYKYKWVQDEKGRAAYVAVEVDEDGNPLRGERLRNAEIVDGCNRRFTEDELLLTSSVVFGFAFSEKLWLEFTISGLKDIQWNESAFESLVLPKNQKDIVRALVESHKYSAGKMIDDVIAKKGKGLVSVLHGPPGTGKTMTAESISELLKCPLYMVSAGELGTDPAKLEYELQKILDIAHSWGAVLLLDEADVFLEKREIHDIHRNALVSIFLRLLEYFQGILFLTTNRVETFDDAFASRIHVALRYGALTHTAKKSVWKMFLELVRKSDETQIADFPDVDLEMLARRELNGRQIKNCVRTAQALALNEKVVMTMSHIKRVLDVSEAFERDLKGGTGYEDAMRSYQ